jgi:hypothetical protein
VSSSGNCVAIVVRKLSGEVVGVVVIDNNDDDNDDNDDDDDGEMVAGHDIGSKSYDDDEDGLTKEDASLIKIWTRHVTVAIEHFENLKGCVEGMGNASQGWWWLVGWWLVGWLVAGCC